MRLCIWIANLTDNSRKESQALCSTLELIDWKYYCMRQWLTILGLFELKINLIIYSGAKLGRPRPVSVVDKDVILLLLFIYFSYDVIFVATGCESRIRLKESGRTCRDKLFEDFIEFLRSEEIEIWNSTNELYQIKTQIDLWSKYQHEISLRTEIIENLGQSQRNKKFNERTAPLKTQIQQ